ncbi:MAG: hypothetical protein V1684_02500 [bacterium]
MERFHPRENYDPRKKGHVLEAEWFGKVFEPLSYEEFNEIYDALSEEARERITFEATEDDAKGRQPRLDYPFKPTKKPARDIREAIAKELGLEVEDKRLRLYTAVWSIHDYKHSVDAWVEFDEGETTKKVTLGITGNPKKEKNKIYNPDIEILVEKEGGLDPIEDKEEYEAKIDETVFRIMEKLGH